MKWGMLILRQFRALDLKLVLLALCFNDTLIWALGKIFFISLEVIFSAIRAFFRRAWFFTHYVRYFIELNKISQKFYDENECGRFISELEHLVICQGRFTNLIYRISRLKKRMIIINRWSNVAHLNSLRSFSFEYRKGKNFHERYWDGLIRLYNLPRTMEMLKFIRW